MPKYGIARRAAQAATAAIAAYRPYSTFGGKRKSKKRSKARTLGPYNPKRAVASRGKRGHSYILTKRKKRSTAVISGDHNDMTGEKIPNSLIPKDLKGATGKFVYNVIKQKINNDVNGIQGVFVGYPIMIRDHIKGTTNVLAQAEQFPDDVFQFAQRLAPATTNAIFNNGTLPLVPDTAIMGLKKVHHEMVVLNMMNTPVEVDVMYYLCRQDCNEDPTQVWDIAVTERGDNQSNAVIRSTLGTLNAGVGRDNFENYGTYPKQRMLSRFYKMIASKKMILQGGNQHKIHTTFDFNRVLSRELSQRTDLPKYLAGYTIWPMFIAKGGAVGISAALETPATEVTYSQTRIGIIQHDAYVFTGLPVPNYDVSRRVIGQLVATSAISKHIDDEDQVDDIEGI